MYLIPVRDTEGILKGWHTLGAQQVGGFINTILISVTSAWHVVGAGNNGSYYHYVFSPLLPRQCPKVGDVPNASFKMPCIQKTMKERKSNFLQLWASV